MSRKKGKLNIRHKASALSLLADELEGSMQPSSANNSARRYDLDNILAGTDTMVPHSKSKEALARVTTVAKKYSLSVDIPKLALEEEIQNKRERFRSSRRNRSYKQRLKKHEKEESAKRIVRSKPSGAVQWIFSFMDNIQDTDKKVAFSDSLDSVDDALKERFDKLVFVWKPVFDQLVVKRSSSVVNLSNLMDGDEGKRIDNRPANRRDTNRRLKLTAWAGTSTPDGDEGDDNPFRAQVRQLFQGLDERGKGFLNLMDFKRFLRDVDATKKGDHIDGHTRFLQSARQDFGVVDTTNAKRIEFEQFYEYCLMMKMFNGTDTKDNQTANKSKSGKVAPRMSFTLESPHDGQQEQMCLGGLPPIVVAASDGNLELVLKLLSTMDEALLPSEKKAIKEHAKSGDVKGTQDLVRDLFTRQTQRKHFVDSMLAEDLDLAKQRLKEMYYNPAGTHAVTTHGHMKSLAELGASVEELDDANEEHDPFNYLKGIGNMKEHGNSGDNSKHKSRVRTKRLGLQLISACSSRGTVDAVQKLLKEGANASYVDANMSTPLMAASWFKQDKIAEVLLKHRAKIMHTNRRGNTAMHFAAEKGSSPLLYLFLRYGGRAALKIKNKIGKTPIDLTKDAYFADVATAALAMSELDTDAISETVGGRHSTAHKDGYIGKGDDMMRSACRKGDTRALRHLVKTGLGSLSSPDRFGITPLMHACYYGKAKTVQFLLENGASAFTQTKAGGNTALHFAFQQERCTDYKRSKRYHGIIKMVLTHNADRAKSLMDLENHNEKLPYEADLTKAAIYETIETPKPQAPQVTPKSRRRGRFVKKKATNSSDPESVSANHSNGDSKKLHPRIPPRPASSPLRRSRHLNKDDTNSFRPRSVSTVESSSGLRRSRHLNTDDTKSLRPRAKLRRSPPMTTV